eukprot:SAG11_NODE_6799_length_1246_cov_2.418483_2_plen_107_part_01
MRCVSIAASQYRADHHLPVVSSYGAGLSEEYVGTGLQVVGVPPTPSWVQVWTKGGPELIRSVDAPLATDEPVGRGFAGARTSAVDFSGRGARLAVAESLKRLGLERI